VLRIVADEKIPFLRGVLEPYAEVVYMNGNLINRDSVMSADALLIRTRTRCDQSLLKGTAVKFIATATIGFDHIDAGFCRAENISWVNAPGCNSSSVQQYVIAALLQVSNDNKITLCGKTLGIIGAGNVGSKVASAANLLGMKVKLNDPPRARIEGSTGFVHLDEILETSDIISIHVPLTMTGEDNTFHLFDKARFRKIKKGAWFINTSRGEVVEIKALKEALQEGYLTGAIIDVWENEPQIDMELLRRVNISTPHIAGYSVDGKANGTAQIVRSLSEYFNLPLGSFYPPLLPLPATPEIVIDAYGKSSEQIAAQAVLHSYPILEDHGNLQRSPATFELQRGQYQVRREFGPYKVKIRNGRSEAIDILSGLGFSVQPEG
jgi:erythronate-4-phosphate dehydrogenase